MKITFLLHLLLLAILCTSCQEETPEIKAENELRDELMAVHDEVMPKMGEMHQLKRQLEKLNETDAVLDSTAIATAIEMLEEADEGMMSWMNQFKQPAKLRGTMEHDEIMDYLEEEKAKIEEVREAMLRSIANAKEIIADYNEAQ